MGEPSVLIGFAKQAVDGYAAIKEAKALADAAKAVAALKELSGCLGIAGALVGFFFSFFGSGPDPEILKLQLMVRDTQTEIATGQWQIMEAIRKLNNAEA